MDAIVAVKILNRVPAKTALIHIAFLLCIPAIATI